MVSSKPPHGCVPVIPYTTHRKKTTSKRPQRQLRSYYHIMHCCTQACGVRKVFGETFYKARRPWTTDRSCGCTCFRPVLFDNTITFPSISFVRFIFLCFPTKNKKKNNNHLVDIVRTCAGKL